MIYFEPIALLLFFILSIVTWKLSICWHPSMQRNDRHFLGICVGQKVSMDDIPNPFNSEISRAWNSYGIIVNLAHLFAP